MSDETTKCWKVKCSTFIFISKAERPHYRVFNKNYIYRYQMSKKAFKSKRIKNKDKLKTLIKKLIIYLLKIFID